MISITAKIVEICLQTQHNTYVKVPNYLDIPYLLEVLEHSGIQRISEGSNKVCGVDDMDVHYATVMVSYADPVDETIYDEWHDLSIVDMSSLDEWLNS